jgi:hypothetical protein
MRDDQSYVVDPAKANSPATRSELFEVMHEMRMCSLYLRGAVIAILDDDRARAVDELKLMGSYMDRLNDYMVQLIFADEE